MNDNAMPPGEVARDRAPQHIPVMLERCMELLGPALTEPGSVLVDGTLGLGGHAGAACAAFPHVRILGIDQDSHAIAVAASRLQQWADRVEIVHANFVELPGILAQRSPVQAVLLDLGISSMQIDDPARGFSYSQSAPLDMRMDPQGPITAADILADYDEARLASMLRRNADERFAGRIARAIVQRRAEQPLTTSTALVDLVARAVPAAAQRTGGHPAKRTFQALRIEVNDELGVLERTLPQVMAALAPGGRVVVLSYHSGEDRIVKKTFATASQPSVPVDMPVIPRDARPEFRLLTRGAEVASEAQIDANPRAASVRLRAVERLREPM